MNRLERALRSQDDKTQKKRREIAGTLGISIDGQRRVEVPDRSGFHYVKLNSNESELIQAFNDKTSPVFGLPVIVVWNVNRYEVLEKDKIRYGEWNSNYLPAHGNQHSFNPEGGGGGDVTFIYGKQFVPLSLSPSGAFGARVAIVNAYPFLNSAWEYFPGAVTDDIVALKPTNNQAKMVLVVVDSETQVSSLIPGTTLFSAGLTGSADVIPYLPVPSGTQVPVAGVRLVSGTTNILWNNIYDVRQFFGGTAGGGGGSSTGDPYSIVLVDASGDVDTENPWLKWGLDGLDEYLDFGANISGKETNAGRIGYQAFSSDALDIVGAGTGVNARNVRIYDNLYINTNTYLSSVLSAGFLGTDGSGKIVPVSGLGATGATGSIVLVDYSGNVTAQNTWFKWGTNSGREFIDLGADIVGKEQNAGRIGYQAFTQGALDIIGVGTGVGIRNVQIYDNLFIGSQTYLQGVLNATLLGTDSNGKIVAVPGGAGSFGVVGWDEGIFLGTGAIFNFVGDGVTATISGSVIRVSVPSSIPTGTLDARYLKLDASNDPLRGSLDIVTPEFEYGLYVKTPNTSPIYVDQIINTDSTDPAIFVDRYSTGTPGTYHEAAYHVRDLLTSTYQGGTLRHVAYSGSVPQKVLTDINPYANPSTGTVLLLDSYNALTENFAIFKRQGTEIFRVNASGTALSNGSPLIKEAPTDGQLYGRKNAGWEVVPAGGGGGSGLGVMAWDEGVPLGTGTIFNFVGSGVTATISGSVVQVNVPGGGGGGRTLIEEKTPAGTGTISFTSIPSTYTHLEIEYVIRSTRAGQVFDELKIRFNGDNTTSNYRYTESVQYGAGSSGQSGADESLVDNPSAANSPTNSASMGRIEIPYYKQTTFNKYVRQRSSVRVDASSNQLANYRHGIEWESTNAINQITLLLVNGLYVAGSTVRLYGTD